ncbi:MAG: glycosyltransferase family 4 protein [Rikenellaceae bacterium]|nr:glycosyltransferase family 4 protein [Rikenellaceae bacterium]
MFGWEFPPHIAGGLGTACYGLTRGLARAGAEVIFVVPKAYGDEDQRFVRVLNASEVEAEYGNAVMGDIWERVKFIHIDSNIVPYASEEEFASEGEKAKKGGSFRDGDIWRERFNFSGKYGTNLMEEVSRFAVVGAEVARMLEGQFDVIHAHDWLTYYAGIAAKRISGKPLVVHIHATEYDRSGENVNTTVYNIEKAGMSAADRVIAVSHLTENIVVNKYGIDPRKVCAVHNAVRFASNEADQAERAIPDKIITFLGRITFQKGPEYFVEAAAKVLKREPKARFVMAGSGDMLNGIIRRVAKLGISDRFHFTGFLRGEEVQRMFALSDVYVMPSVSEPFGISPLEAMKSNVPVIISKQSGVAEVLKYAIKVDYWDVDALADAIYGLIKYPALSDMFITKGQEEVTAMKWNNAALKVIDVYKDAINNPL